jgi:hypothetical protein
LIDFSNCVLIIAKNCLNNEKTLLFFFIKNTHPNLLWSSMKVRMYWANDKKVMVKGPHTLVCTSSKLTSYNSCCVWVLFFYCVFLMCRLDEKNFNQG